MERSEQIRLTLPELLLVDQFLSAPLKMPGVYIGKVDLHAAGL